MSTNTSAEDFERTGKSHYEKGHALEAARAFESAMMAFHDRGDELKAAEHANNASVAFIQAGMAKNALHLVEGTPEIFAKAGDLKQQGLSLGNLGAVLEALDQNSEAISAYQQSAEILRAAGEDQLQLLAVQSLSMLQLKEGGQLQALASMQSGLEKIKKPNTKQSFLKRLLKIPMEMMTKKR